MTADRREPNGPDELDLVENYCADLLGRRGNEPIVAALLKGPGGQWQPIHQLAAGRTIDASLGTPKSVKEDLFAAWLDLPLRDNPDFVIIVFQLYSEELMWGTTATYNRGRLLKNLP